jgi:2-polyprenyl-3-methyl-5-hydroxy-6-metoxy-1,4-benzoquinol methylase
MQKLEARSESQSHQGVERSHLRSLVRVALALVVLVGVCLLWLVLFVLFAPWLLLAEVVRLVRRQPRGADEASAVVGSDNGASDVPLVFDRRNDVSKLYGCNTRNVRYRWTLFAGKLNQLLRERERPKALDFGAGSLRDSYELAKRGFEVTAFDLNARVLRSYHDSYDWTAAKHKPTLMTGSLEDLKESVEPDSLQLVLAFDVIEHLEDPASYVQALSEVLSQDGLLFTIVPNKRSLFETYFRHTVGEQLRRGVALEPGVPHLQFKSPEEWDRFFQANGFQIVDRDMTIGHFVNDWWNGLLSIPLWAYVYPVVNVLAFRTGRKIDAGRFERTLCPAWLMERIHSVDLLFERWLKPRYGWNLIVAQRSRPGASVPTSG